MRRLKNSHCSYCGAMFDIGYSWPKKCDHCDETTWISPSPVVVLIVPIEGDEPRAVGVRRAIQPKKGEVALPGGFMTIKRIALDAANGRPFVDGETWQEAGVRELLEETGIVIDPATMTLVDTVSTPGGREVLIFGKTQPIPDTMLSVFIPNEEVSELVMLRGDEDLAFSLHTDALRKFMKQYARAVSGAPTNFYTGC